jgi:outer membrane lipopolysaccharide assembly protein LptE/RlpB
MKHLPKFFALLLLSALFGCGYHVLGRETHLPEGVTSVAVAPTLNKTNEPETETYLTQALIRELKSDGRLRVEDKKNASAVLHSELTAIDDRPLGYDRFGRANLMQVVVTGRVFLVSAESNKELWSSGVLTETEQHPVNDNTISNHELQERAMEQACQRMAKIAIDKLLSGF